MAVVIINRTRTALLAGILCAVIVAEAHGDMAAVTYTYDQLGRLVTARYETGHCVAYTYDANGNRTAQNVTTSGETVSPTWGTGPWACFVWTPN